MFIRQPTSRQLAIQPQLASILRPRSLNETNDLSALIIADPMDDLPGARAEGQALFELFEAHGTATVTVCR